MKKQNIIFSAIVLLSFGLACTTPNEEVQRLRTHELASDPPFIEDFFKVDKMGQEGLKVIYTYNQGLFIKIDKLEDSTDPLVFLNEMDETYYKFDGKKGDKIYLPWEASSN